MQNDPMIQCNQRRSGTWLPLIFSSQLVEMNQEAILCSPEEPYGALKFLIITKS